MRIGACVGMGVLVVALAGALTGCAPDAPPVLPPETPAVEPMFASDEEALAAAEEAYAAYLAMSDQILIDGGANPERLLEVATDEAYEVELEGYEKAAAMGWRSTGGTTFSNMTLQQYDDTAVVVYVCEDVSAVDVLDATSVSVVSDARPDRTAYEIELLGRDNGLIVSAKSTWGGSGVC